MTHAQPIWQSLKDTLVRAGFEPWLRPIIETVRGRERDADDIAARRIIARLPADACCVDVGCHKGVYLDPMRRQAVRGRFFAFEPIPYLHDLLKAKYRADPRVTLFNMALSTKSGTTELFINETDMGLSGLSRRPGRRGIDQDRLRRVVVPVHTLDEILGEQRVDFIKIDVEGAEFDVLQGAKGVIARCRPVVLFEFGLGGADYFGVDAERMFAFFEACGYAIYRVPAYAAGGTPLDRESFGVCFATNSAFNFVAAPGPRA